MRAEIKGRGNDTRVENINSFSSDFHDTFLRMNSNLWEKKTESILLSLFYGWNWLFFYKPIKVYYMKKKSNF